MLYKFCPKCSGFLELKHIPQEDRSRLVCIECGFIFYINPSPAVAVILLKDDKIVLVRRKYEPKQGLWSLPAGFLEYDETIEQTAIREVKEETNLNIQLKGLLGVYSAFDDPRKQVLLVVYRGEIINGELKPGDDADEVKFFSLNELPDDIAFSCHRHVLNKVSQEIQ